MTAAGLKSAALTAEGDIAAGASSKNSTKSVGKKPVVPVAQLAYHAMLSEASK
jgi:hypothetical protein